MAFDVSPWLDALIRLFLVALILTITWVINLLFGRIVIGAVSKRNRNVAYEVSSVGGIVIWTAGVLLTLPVLGASDTVVSVVILLAGAFLILATRDFAGNWFAGQTIKKIIPFKVGDWIRVSGVYGRVVKIDDLYTTLVTPENETVTMPNSKLTSDFILDRSSNGSVKIPVEFEVPSGVESGVMSLAVGNILQELAGRFAEAGTNELPEMYVLSQTVGAVRLRAVLTIANPAREEEAKSEFRKRLSMLRWPEGSTR
jgi:small conductance mechanosensitive channel